MSTTNLVKDALAKTLRELLEERSIDKITVEEIAEKSSLSKRTFYNHFRDKHDLVSYIWRKEYEACQKHNGKLVSYEEFLTRYHALEASQWNFFRNTLPYSGQNNLWETVYDAAIEHTKNKMRANGYTGEFEGEIMRAIEFWIHGLSGISRMAFDDIYIRHMPPDELSPEEHARREIALIPNALRPWLLP